MVKKIQGYTLLECVGKGSSGQVFKATHCYKEGQFAIKVIENQLLQQNPKAEQCLINQVKILSKIGPCDSIVNFHQLIKTKNNHYFVYDFCNGGNLYEKIKKVKRIPQNEAIKYVKDILSAFKILNKYKVLHRDLKPENILFHNGKLKLADFGLCKGLKPQQFMTKTMLGSPIYMAPEVLKGQSYTSKADIWSLGVIIFQMLYGYCPYHSNSIASLASKIDTTTLQLPEKPVVSTNTKQVLKKMLNKDHFRRIGWIQLFNQFINQQGQQNSVKSIYIQQNNERKRSLSKCKRNQQSKKTSLCLIQNITPVSNLVPYRETKLQRQQSVTPQKQNRTVFNSSKYMTILNKNQQKTKRPSNFQPPNQNLLNLPVSTSNYSSPIYYKQYQKGQKSSNLNVNNSSYSGSNINNKCYTKSNQNSSNKIQFSPTTQKHLKQFINKLQKLHQQFVKIYPYCQTLLKTKIRENLTEILQFLLIMRMKLMKFNSQFTKIKKQMYAQHEDLETMIKYEIIGIQNTIQNISICLNDKNYKNYFAFGNYNNAGNFANCGYKFKNYVLEKVVTRIFDIQI